MGLNKFSNVLYTNINRVGNILSTNIDKVGADVLSTSDSYTKLLLHMSGIENIFSDYSSSYKTITAYGNITQSTEQKKFGVASAALDGNDYLRLSASEDWNLGTGNFTIDFWVRFTAIGGDYGSNSPNNQYFFDIGSNQSFLHWSSGYWMVQNPSMTVVLSYANTPSLNTWIHVALSRSGNTWYLFLNGSLVSSVSNTSAFGGSDRTLTIGNYGGGGTYGVMGYLDEFRFSKGIVRWTSNFTPPTSAY